MKNDNNIYKTIEFTYDKKKQNKILHDDSKHYPNKDEAKLLRRLMSETGLTEDEIKSYKKYRKMLSEAQKKSEKAKYSKIYKFYKSIVDTACNRTGLANQHPKTIKEIENVIKERNHSTTYKPIGIPHIISPKSAKSIVDYVNGNKKKK